MKPTDGSVCAFSGQFVPFVQFTFKGGGGCSWQEACALLANIRCFLLGSFANIRCFLLGSFLLGHTICPWKCVCVCV